MARPRMGLIWDIRPYSIHDGPGIRTTVFLKGCPLRCPWCCNPEAQQGKPEILRIAENCLACGGCIRACPRGAISAGPDGAGIVDRAACDLCGACVESCPGEALQIVGRRRTVAQVLDDVGRDEAFHRRSGGGITLSGGEPFTQISFTRELLREYRRAFPGGHTAVETCGYAAWEEIRRTLPLIDLVLFDLKHMDGRVHKRWTGVSNRSILANARRIARFGTPLVLRVPLIPGVNDSTRNLTAAAIFAKSLPGLSEIHLLPYHRWGEPKHARLGRAYALAGTKPPRRECLEEIKTRLERFGLRVKIGG